MITTAPTQLNQLIERFRDNLPDYKAGKYNETQVRREFIDPLFKLLGWDIDNEKGYAEAYKETGESVAQTRTVIQRQIEATDREIDRLVYELYGLNDEEIRTRERQLLCKLSPCGTLSPKSHTHYSFFIPHSSFS